MQRRWCKGTLMGVLMIVGTSWLGAYPAQAQFPIFYGGEVLTPFGNRNSDGSYRTAPPRRSPPRPPTQTRYYAPQPQYYSYAPRPQYYYAPRPQYYYAPRPQYYYAPNGYFYRR